MISAYLHQKQCDGCLPNPLSDVLQDSCGVLVIPVMLRRQEVLVSGLIACGPSWLGEPPRDVRLVCISYHSLLSIA